MGLTEAIADIDVARDAIAACTTLEELKQCLADNLFPVVKGVADATNEHFVEFADAVKTITEDIEDLREGEGELLYPETTQKLVTVLDTGAMIATELEALLAKQDNATRKRCKALIDSYRQGKNVIADVLAAITMPEEVEEADQDEALVVTADNDNGEGDDDEDDGEDEGEGDDNEFEGGEGAPVTPIRKGR